MLEKRIERLVGVYKYIDVLFCFPQGKRVLKVQRVYGLGLDDFLVLNYVVGLWNTAFPANKWAFTPLHDPNGNLEYFLAPAFRTVEKTHDRVVSNFLRFLYERSPVGDEYIYRRNQIHKTFMRAVS